MSTVNVGSALPAGTNIIGVVKLVDTAGTNQWGIDANNNGHVAIYNGANAMGVDANNNAHVGIWNGTNQMAVNAGGNAAINVSQVSGSAVSTAATGVQKVGIVGSAGASLDATVGAGTAPTNALIAGLLYNATAPAPTTGQSMALQADQAGNVRTVPGIALTTLSAWSSGTALNATQNIFTNSGVPAVLVQLDQTTTITAGAITFEATFDGSNWVTITANTVLDPTSTSYAQISLPYTLQASTNKPFLISNNGWQGLRIKLSTQITGTGTVTPNYALLAYDPADSAVVYSPTAANFLVTASQGGSNWSMNLAQVAGTNTVTGGASGLLAVGGPVASGSANADNPVKTGAVFNTTQPTVTSGQIVDVQATSRGALLVATGVDTLNATINGVAASLTQANQVPVSNAGQQGQLTLTGTLTANSDNSITFSGNSTVARRIRIQNESTGVIYWALDATASAGSPSIINPGSNAVSVEWINMACTTLHIFIPTGGTTTLNGSGGVKVSAWA